MEEFRILSPTAILGYGFPEESFVEGMKRKPHVIAVDAGSTDPGPYYLGAGISFTDRNSVKRDLSYMIPAGLENKIPVIVGTAGGSGAAPHLQWNLEIIEELAKEMNLHFKLAIIPADIATDVIIQKFNEGKIKPLHPAPELTGKDIKDSVRTVAQMGYEPFIKALEMGADVILAGRAYDPSNFSTLAIMRGYDKGLAIHLGKILECAAIASTPGSGSDCMMGYLGDDYFKVSTLNPDVRRCTTLSVAAHTLYEKTNPYILPGPGGVLNLEETKFEQESDQIVKVTGSKFIPTEGFFVKLEGVKRVGYRTVSIAGTSDPVMIEKINDIVAGVKLRVKNNFEKYGITDFFLDFKIYGKKGVMSIFEGVSGGTSHELCIVIEAVGKTQAEADTICSFARSTMLHYGYEGRISTAGNLAFPFSPSDFHVGEVFEFCIYHLMEVDDPCEFFPITIKEF